MSDANERAGWWKASDGNLYPPELHPNYAPPSVPEPEVQQHAEQQPETAPESVLRPGWWQASDGNWYPPERHPDYQPPSPAPPAATAPPPAPSPPVAPTPPTSLPAQGSGYPPLPPPAGNVPAPIEGTAQLGSTAQPPHFPPPTHAPPPALTPPQSQWNTAPNTQVPPPSPFVQPPATSYAYSQSSQQSSGNGFSIAGIICGVLALVICPPLLGIAGIVLGAVGKNKGESLGIAAIVVSAIGLVVGWIIFPAIVGGFS